jgi:hypothetical protein
MADGSIVLPLEWCADGSARWSLVTCQDPFTCDGSTLARWYRYRVTYDGGLGRWTASIEALSDAGTGEPCAGVLTCVLFSGQDDGGDCCGVSSSAGGATLGCCNLGGAVSATWSVAIGGNPCCRDGEGNCVAGSGDCSGGCGGLP